MFITFEGLDGSGKSTHLKRAAAWLAERGIDAVVTREPGGTALGQRVRELFLDRRWGRLDGGVEALLVFASRRQHLLEIIEPALADGRWVLCDRFTDSTHAYQGAGRGVAATTIAGLDDLATGGRQPDLTLLFDLPAEDARARGQSSRRRQRDAIDRIDAEDLEFYRRVRDGFLALAAAAPTRIVRVDASGPREVTWTQVEGILQRAFDAARSGASNPPGDDA
ncbi:MAG: dTMP kinase [Acidobacteriota bacterium]